MFIKKLSLQLSNDEYINIYSNVILILTAFVSIILLHFLVEYLSTQSIISLVAIIYLSKYFAELFFNLKKIKKFSDFARERSLIDFKRLTRNFDIYSVRFLRYLVFLHRFRRRFKFFAVTFSLNVALLILSLFVTLSMLVELSIGFMISLQCLSDLNLIGAVKAKLKQVVAQIDEVLSSKLESNETREVEELQLTAELQRKLRAERALLDDDHDDHHDNKIIDYKPEKRDKRQIDNDNNNNTKKTNKLAKRELQENAERSENSMHFMQRLLNDDRLDDPEEQKFLDELFPHELNFQFAEDDATQETLDSDEQEKDEFDDVTNSATSGRTLTNQHAARQITQTERTKKKTKTQTNAKSKLKTSGIAKENIDELYSLSSDVNSSLDSIFDESSKPPSQSKLQLQTTSFFEPIKAQPKNVIRPIAEDSDIDENSQNAREISSDKVQQILQDFVVIRKTTNT